MTATGMGVAKRAEQVGLALRREAVDQFVRESFDRGVSRSTWRDRKARLTSPRRRVCAGGSSLEHRAAFEIVEGLRDAEASPASRVLRAT